MYSCSCYCHELQYLTRNGRLVRRILLSKTGEEISPVMIGRRVSIH